MKQESQLVVAIKNGTVIDHIPSAKLFEVVNLLHLQDVRDSAIIVGYNLKSKKFGHKSLIKVFDKFFTDAELNQLSVVAPNVTLCIIRDYEVVEKKSVTLPEELRKEGEDEVVFLDEDDIEDVEDLDDFEYDMEDED